MRIAFDQLGLSSGSRFPILRTIDDVLPAIEGRNEFIVANRGEFTVIDYVYNLPDSFGCLATAATDEERRTALIRRELRGIKFRTSDGSILARGWHKFFNLNEKPETQAGAVDWSVPCLALDKLDGSAIQAARLDAGLVFMTMMGVTDIARQAMAFGLGSGAIAYGEFCEDAIDAGFTPLFEWCSRRSKIVVDYPEDQLVLTGLRHLETGRYVQHDDLVRVAGAYGVPVVRAWGGSLEDLAAFVEHTRSLLNFEGYIVAFEDGNRLKLKADDYVLRHKAKDKLLLEKDVVGIIAQGKDDDIVATLPVEDADALRAFSCALRSGLAETAAALEARARSGMAQVGGDRKRFATEIAPSFDLQTRGVAYEVVGGGSAYAFLVRMVAKASFTSTRVEEVRHLWGGSRWEDFWLIPGDALKDAA